MPKAMVSTIVFLKNPAPLQLDVGGDSKIFNGNKTEQLFAFTSAKSWENSFHSVPWPDDVDFKFAERNGKQTLLGAHQRLLGMFCICQSCLRTRGPYLKPPLIRRQTLHPNVVIPAHWKRQLSSVELRKVRRKGGWRYPEFATTFWKDVCEGGRL